MEQSTKSLIYSLFVALLFISLKAWPSRPAYAVQLGETLSFDNSARSELDYVHVVTELTPEEHIVLTLFEKKNSSFNSPITTELIRPLIPRSSIDKIIRLSEMLIKEEISLEQWPYICAMEPIFPKQNIRGLRIANLLEPPDPIPHAYPNYFEILSPQECWTGYSSEPRSREGATNAALLKGFLQGIRDQVLFQHFTKERI